MDASAMTEQATKSDYQWFVIHTLSGQEQKVKDNIEKRIKVEEMADYVKEVLIPTEKVAEVKKGKKTTSTRKFYPGYILVHMKLLDEKNQLVERSWYFVRETPGIIGFIGGDRPVPLKPDEVNSILAQIEERQEKVAPKVAFELGETVKVTDGPFQNFTGVIEEIDPARGKLKISVSIFGRSTPVELEYWQVERG
jgi:transcriptional antiterminator NusG